jgi:AsmA protein
MEHLRLMIEADEGVYTLIPLESQYYGEEEEGKLVIRPFEEPPAYHLDYSVKKFPIDEFLSTFYNDEIISGSVDLVLDLDFSGNDVESITKNMDGKISFNGKQLTLNGMNLNEFINNFRRSQRFNLVDLGAVMLAGPAGVMVTKGSDYAMIMAGNMGEKTTISQFASVWDIDDGKITIKDVAFATLENRVAAQGWIDMRSDSLDVTIAILDENGCSLINQNISGSGSDPVYSNVKIIKTLLAPVTKLLKNITLQDCEKFYEGVVEHPVKEKQ